MTPAADLLGVCPKAIKRSLMMATALSLCLLSGSGLAQTTLIRHALSQEQNAKVLTYEQAVLKLLLDKTIPTYGPYRLQPSEVVSQNRAFLQLSAGELEVLSSMTSQAREAQAIPVRVCLYRGLMGVRLPIALISKREQLEAISSASQAQALSVGQVADWPDAKILSANGWKVERMAKLSPFAEMLKRERIDLFALGAVEVFPIIDAMPGLTVLDQWLIAYPSAFYFFVSPQSPALAERLRKGWELVLADGSFEALFEHWVDPQLLRAKLAERRWLILSNPDLPAATPLGDARLWHPLVRSRLQGKGPP
ncbi:transporter substrate-binding domain-containing protein [Paucibacter sp. B2R-40]|uniref:transporter substrate-binding domain-containing protein n=1 Tax=Paucibacter sp. B2R-40 TaxID=2893554 RepID=UPI0021E36A4D|nr:transporter substrate-binding domain-containing protein [Paucibacter sp. B2R-40]MCV2356797.1 transporter substrate-binding domain-containing protein [Paucibacter sp. B2R-40]